jgi:hypothetical protein
MILHHVTRCIEASYNPRGPRFKPRTLHVDWVTNAGCVRMRPFVQPFPFPMLQTPRTEIQTQDTHRRLSDKWSRQSFPFPMLKTLRTEFQTQDTHRRLSDKWSRQPFPFPMLQTPRTEFQTQDNHRRLSDKCKLCKNASLCSAVSVPNVTNPEDRDSNPRYSTSIEWQMKPSVVSVPNVKNPEDRVSNPGHSTSIEWQMQAV